MTLDLRSYDPDLGERLHRELSEVDLPHLDAIAMTAAGGRAVRRRRLGAAASSSAAALALLLGGYAASTSFSNKVTPAPPAASSSTVSGPVTARLEPFTNLGGEVGTIDPGAFRNLAVTWQPQPLPNGSDLTYSTYAEDGKLTTIGGSSTLGLAPNGITWGTPGPDSHIIVGVLPSAATAFQVLTPADPKDGHISTFTKAPLAGSPWQAFAVFFEEERDVESVLDILWTDAAGVVRDKDGGVVPSVRLADQDHSIVYVSSRGDGFGTFGLENSALVRLSDRTARSPYPVLSFASGDKDTLTGLFAMLIPSGSSAPQVRAAASLTRSSDPRIEPIPGTDWAVLWSEYTQHGAPSTRAYTKVSWTGPDGKHTEVTTY